MTDEEIEAMEIDWTQGVAENFERVKSAALAALDAANKRADEAEAKVFCPGTWRCPKCEFVLLQRNLNALDGSVTARDEAGDKCPNCNNTLWRVSWEQEAREAYGVVERYFDEKQAAVAELTTLRARVAELADEAEARRKCYECGSEMTACAQCNPELVSAELTSLRARLEAETKRADEAEAESSVGWLFLNPDTGIEFNVNHPVESGEVPDAKNITSATAPALLHLLTEEWRDGKARESELTAIRARVAELEAGGCARDQGTTQYCAEAVALQKRVAELEVALEQLRTEYDHQIKWGEDYEYREAGNRVQQIIDAALKKEPTNAV